MKDHSLTLAGIFRSGMTAEEAVASLVEHSNTGPDVLFLTDGWFAPYRRKLLDLLPERITADQAAALVDILYKRRKLDAMVTWLEHQPHPWPDVNALLARLGRERLEAIREQGFFPWDDVDACRGNAQEHLRPRAASVPPASEELRDLKVPRVWPPGPAAGMAVLLEPWLDVGTTLRAGRTAAIRFISSGM